MCVIFSICVLGKRLLKDIALSDCHKNITGPLFKQFCGNATNMYKCESEYFKMNNVTRVKGIRGLASGVFWGNKSHNSSVILV